MSFDVHPVIVLAVVGGLAALVLIGFACRARRRWIKVTMVLLGGACIAPAVAVFLALHPELIDGRYQTYKAFYDDIEVGMTREQVFEAMESRYSKESGRHRPIVMRDEINSVGFFMNPEGADQPNCEGIFVTFDHGRVTKAVYSPD